MVYQREILTFLITTLLSGPTSSLLCNVAFRRPTTHSTAYYSDDLLNGYSCNAVDGSSDQDFFQGSCFHSKPEASPWWEVNLGDTYTIDFVNISARTDNHVNEHFKKMENIQITVDGISCTHFSGPLSAIDAVSPVSLPCAPGAIGQRLKILRTISSENLMFCEVEVYANIPGISVCPDPPSTWKCRDLCFETNNSFSCETTVAATTTVVPMTTTQSPVTSSTCYCDCSLMGSSVLNGLTKEEILEKYKDIIEDLRVNADETSKAKNKLISAADNRPTTIAIGSMGILVLLLVAGTIILMDANVYIRVFKNIRKMYRKMKKSHNNKIVSKRTETDGEQQEEIEQKPNDD